MPYPSHTDPRLTAREQIALHDIANAYGADPFSRGNLDSKLLRKLADYGHLRELPDGRFQLIGSE